MKKKKQGLCKTFDKELSSEHFYRLHVIDEKLEFSKTDLTIRFIVKNIIMGRTPLLSTPFSKHIGRSTLIKSSWKILMMMLKMSVIFL